MRVLAINDLSCIGKCSLSVTLPVLSACGITCDVLPTAILSTHTGGFTGYTFRDLTDDILGILQHWKTLNVRFDYVYSGYLGSIEQIQLVSHIHKEFLAPNGTFVVDPVMGDSGKLYDGFTTEFVDQMRKLCKEADYILPNLTEACYLANVPFPSNGNDFNTTALLEKLQTFCPRPIVTGITNGRTISVAYVDAENRVKEYSHENVDGFFCGAGDVFASAFVGCLARGKTEETSIRLASDFTALSIIRSAKEVSDKRYGLNFERELFGFLKNLEP
ncbi:MAG: pyridoxamine kinase [Clostridia bacterium]|nr:pyridoxamine kinase [Clostridia bacterium]